MEDNSCGWAVNITFVVSVIKFHLKMLILSFKWVSDKKNNSDNKKMKINVLTVKS